MTLAARRLDDAVTILDFLDDPALTPGSYEGASWEAWRAVLSAAFALPLDAKRRRIFRKLAGNRQPPKSRVRELWAIAGRRSAKTHIAAAIADYLATVGAEQDGLLSRLSHGERGVISIIAVDRYQARVALNYIYGLIDASPVLSQMVERRSAESVDFVNRISIEVHTNSFRSVRGRTLLAAILDECAFYRDEQSASPDVEVYRAILPSLATTGGLLIGISSPYAKKGLLYQKWKKHYGKSGDILVVQGATTDFNPTIDKRVISDAEADDPESAKAEWHGQFRSDVESFIARETVERAMRTAPLELPFDRKHTYFAFTDPSGGGADGFTLAIGHLEAERVIVDVLRERKRMAPAAVVAEYAELLRGYCLSKVTGDKYAGSWPEQEFSRHGIRYESSAKPKSELYLDALSLLNSERAELPPDDIMLNQFCNLERRTSRAGRDSIDHSPGSHDDRANAVAGLIAAQRKKRGHAGVW